MPQDTSYANPTRSYSTMPPGLTFTVGRRDNDAYLAVIGALDIATHHALTQAATAVLHPPTRALVLDLHRVTFFGAAGVTALAEHQARCRQRRDPPCPDRGPHRRPTSTRSHRYSGPHTRGTQPHHRPTR